MMKMNISKEWCLKMAHAERDSEIGAGLISFDPVFYAEMTAPSVSDVSNIAFGRFVRLMRRDQKLSLEQLAINAGVDIEELVEIEDDVYHKTDVRTVDQLAQVFHVPRNNLLQIAGLIAQENDVLFHEAVRFTARSDPLTELSPQERIALEAFVTALSQQK